MSPGCNDVSGKELQPCRHRRTHIPDKPNYSLNLWSIMKNCIGKELSKIPMPVREYGHKAPCQQHDGITVYLQQWFIFSLSLPFSLSLSLSIQVNFNEPLSMLQRLTEDLEYHELLDKAARCDSSLEQMCLVAAFSVSSYSTTVHRTAKPFNPLLGETYELDRLEEFGYRSLCEQVTAAPSEDSSPSLCSSFLTSSVFPLVSGEPSPSRCCTSRDFPTRLDPVAGDHNCQQVSWQIPLHHASG